METPRQPSNGSARSSASHRGPFTGTFRSKKTSSCPSCGALEKSASKFSRYSAPDADPIDTLVHAFTTEVAERHVEEFDRKFMTLIVKDPQYRLRWLDWGENLCEPVTEFLARHFDLGEDPFLRTLPAHLILETGRQVYIRWVDSGDFAELEASHRAGMRMILSGLRRREYALHRHSEHQKRAGLPIGRR